MGGLAVLAKQAGHTVSGSDANPYPPMSTQLIEHGIDLMEGYHKRHLQPHPDLVLIGNVLSRGNTAVEYILAKDIAYLSGPQWLAEHFLKNRQVLAVAGTHGKTTTASLLAWILESAQLEPGFLIGGVANNFSQSARAGRDPFFVIEADEYDSAFFDKRSKFLHYHPRTVILHDLEFDHADIFSDLGAIQKQFHQLLRTVPGNGLIIHNADSQSLDEVIQMGCWTPCEAFSCQQKTGWSFAKPTGNNLNDSDFVVCFSGQPLGQARLAMPGKHNRLNAIAAIAAARHVGVPVPIALDALGQFTGVKRRMEQRGSVNDICVYDDFAHHPTAISLTLNDFKQRAKEKRVIAVLEPASNTMRMGVHRQALIEALRPANQVILYRPKDIQWDLQIIADVLGDKVHLFDDMNALLQFLCLELKPQDQVLIMSNGRFANIHERLLQALRTQNQSTSH